MMQHLTCAILSLALISPMAMQSWGQDLEKRLMAESRDKLVADALSQGDAKRGALLFFQPHLSCSRCHSVAEKTPTKLLGPNLAAKRLNQPTPTDVHLVESVLEPSKTIATEHRPIVVLSLDGSVTTGIPLSRDQNQLVLQDLNVLEKRHVIAVSDIEKETSGTLSLMPAGLVNLLNSRGQFLDLIKYLIEIRDGGFQRAGLLQPPASMLALSIPEYEKSLDHAGLIRSWNNDSLDRGKAIYNRVCANCHGTHDQPGSLPTSLRFAEGKFKNGSDPLSMYRTMTYGYSQMAPQSWMVPSQKYDVIHYIREAYLKSHNPTQFSTVDESYLGSLPIGNTFGPEPSTIEAWSAMDYGPTLTHTFEIPHPQRRNLAFKGIAVRLDSGPGGIARGGQWMLYDTDTLRVAAGWSGNSDSKNNFIDWQGIQFNGAHGVHPRTVGQTAFSNSIGPGWANPNDESFSDQARVQGRDGKRYGPLPRAWTNFQGLYHYENRAVLAYTVGSTQLLESPSLIQNAGHSLLARQFNIGPRSRDLILQVAEHSSAEARISPVRQGSVLFAAEQPAESVEKLFDGNSYLQVESQPFDMNSSDFTISARVRTWTDGTIWALTTDSDRWQPNGQTFFIRGGKLTYDIGWVGAVAGKSKVDDGDWHDVAVTWEASTQQIRLYLDGKLDGQGKLAAKSPLKGGLIRIGFTSPNFPSKPYLSGEISQIKFWQHRFDQAAQLSFPFPEPNDLKAHWELENVSDNVIHDNHSGIRATVQHGLRPAISKRELIVSGFSPVDLPLQWISDKASLRLRIPAGKEPLRFTLWMSEEGAKSDSLPTNEFVERYREVEILDPSVDLDALTNGGPPRWPQMLTTAVQLNPSVGPFSSDTITAPDNNPWFAQMRFTGLDFFPDGRLAVCTWDGDVWLVSLDPQIQDYQVSQQQTAIWQRIASGMFQPLGLKIVDGQIFVICRDQLTKLHDLNGDGEIDFYQCFNNDHQVTEHFHEFAMGLQVDSEGNFYYAKSGQHGLAAVVPHHGTLLRVSRDGTRTDILANGFRAANGVCLNPDGTFVVTDQEGFWNPKNRINWVTLDPSGKPKFYGNMLGYHDVTDSSDSAMEQPLCWITNAFDRSPGELLWVDSPRWGKLNGSLLNLSYGYGKVFLVPHEKVGQQMQGGMIELPIPNFPTGVMRGRFHPLDQQLYLCGMFAWAGNATQPGGLYRLRTTGQPMNLPTQLHASGNKLMLTFTDTIDSASVDKKNFQVRSWSLKRTANYGSKHYDEQELPIAACELSGDRRTVSIVVPELRPTWCMEITYTIRSQAGETVQGTIHNTIHRLSE